MSLIFRTHPLIGENCIGSDAVVRYRSANDKRTRRMRVGKAGSLVMIAPDPEVNSIGDVAWFGVLTWIQPAKEVNAGSVRLCEVWWVYQKHHLIDMVKKGKSQDKKRLLESVRGCHKKQAWVSNHFSDEPLDSIMTIPTYDEMSDRIKLSHNRYLEIDTENGVYGFQDVIP